MTGSGRKKAGVPGSRRKTRSGIPVFDRKEDIAGLFLRKEQDMEEVAGSAAAEPSCPGSRETVPSPEHRPKNRHGLPLLDGEKSISGLFRSAGKVEKEESFAELVEASLKGKSPEALLRAKRERGRPEPVPLQRRIKRFPSPEMDLDLHGFTAAAAEVRTASFLRSAYQGGLFTVRIIVGRGLHSEFGAVLPDVVEDILTDLKQEGLVLWFRWEKKKKSRSGAVIAYLNRFND